jgi:hypothetical protein
MRCKNGDELNEKMGETLKAWGDYDKSLRGVPRTSEHRQENDRLEKAAEVARFAWTEHQLRCPDCR